MPEYQQLPSAQEDCNLFAPRQLRPPAAPPPFKNTVTRSPAPAPKARSGFAPSPGRPQWSIRTFAGWARLRVCAHACGAHSCLNSSSYTLRPPRTATAAATPPRRKTAAAPPSALRRTVTCLPRASSRPASSPAPRAKKAVTRSPASIKRPQWAYALRRAARRSVAYGPSQVRRVSGSLRSLRLRRTCSEKMGFKDKRFLGYKSSGRVTCANPASRFIAVAVGSSGVGSWSQKFSHEVFVTDAKKSGQTRLARLFRGSVLKID